MCPGVLCPSWTAVRLVIVGLGSSFATQGILSPLRGPLGVLDPSRSLVRLRALGPCRSVEALRPCRSLVRVKVHGPKEIRVDVGK